MVLPVRGACIGILIIMLVILTAASAMETRLDPETKRIRVIYGVAFGNALMVTRQDPRFDVRAVIPPLTYERTMDDLEYSKRLARIYMPRSYGDLVENTDLVIIEIDTRAFTPENHAWFRDGVIEEGLGLVMGGGSQGFGANQPFTSWCETHVNDILPVECYFDQRHPKDYLVRLKVAEPGNELAARIPWESSPLYYPCNVISARPGCVPLVVSDDREETLIYFYWDVGRGRSVGVQNTGGAFCKGFDIWEYYPDTVLNTFYYAVAFPIPEDVAVMHELRASWHRIHIEKSLLYGLVEFADKFGASVMRIENGMRNVDLLKRSSDSLYMDEDYTAAVERMGEALRELEDLQGLAVSLKDRALLWIYLIEWLAVLSALMASGSVLWTLMVRRAIYREVETTQTPPR